MLFLLLEAKKPYLLRSFHEAVFVSRHWSRPNEVVYETWTLLLLQLLL